MTAATVAGATAIALVGCADDSSDNGSAGSADSNGDGARHELSIGWVPANTTGVFNTATSYFEAAVAEANENGFDIDLTVQAPTGGEANSAGFQQIIENLISTDVDVIVVSPGDSEAIKPAVRAANDAGIPVVYVNLLDDPDDVDVSAFVGFDNVDAGRISAYSVLDYFGGPGVLGAGEKVEVAEEDYLDLAFWEELYADADLSDVEVSGALIEGVKGTIYSNQRLQGFNEVMELAPGVEVVTTLAGDWDRQVGADAAAAIITRYEELDFIWAASNEMALGASSILKGADRLDVNADNGEPTPGLTALFTNDNTGESTDAIRAGDIIAETSHGFADWGWVGTQVAVELACGLEAERFNDIRPRTVYVGNADQFYPEPSLPEIDWAEIAESCDAS
ncbi:sugar ABC transporter substrate-binding protein [Ornithinimicrobium pratense]|nr:sugar ABC transporter substrate-binding protein [Ornithinimicrobium pratense]